MDTSVAESPLWGDAQSFVRFSGINFTSVFYNISLQGEYGMMLKDNSAPSWNRPSSWFQSKTPDAMVLSALVGKKVFNISPLGKKANILPFKNILDFSKIVKRYDDKKN